MTSYLKLLASALAGFALAFVLRLGPDKSAPRDLSSPVVQDVVSIPTPPPQLPSPSAGVAGEVLLVDPASSLALVVQSLVDFGWDRRQISRAIAAKLEADSSIQSDDYWRPDHVLTQFEAAEREREVQARIDLHLSALGLETRSERSASFLKDPGQRALTAELIRLAAEAQGSAPGDSASTSTLLQFAEQTHPELFSKLSPETRERITLQFSEAAVRLRALPDMDWTPEIFSQTLAVEKRHADRFRQDPVGSASPEADQARLQELEGVLGDLGLAQYLRVHDPAYEAVALWAHRHGLTAETSARLYDLGVAAASQPSSQPGDEALPTLVEPAETKERFWERVRQELPDPSLADDFASGPGSWLISSP